MDRRDPCQLFPAKLVTSLDVASTTDGKHIALEAVIEGEADPVRLVVRMQDAEQLIEALRNVSAQASGKRLALN